MKFIYPAVFKKTDDGRYRGTFPDLESCYGEGDTLDEAIENANAAAFDWISLELSEEVPELPPITDPDDMDLEEGDVVRNIQVNIRLYDGWDEYCTFKNAGLFSPAFFTFILFLRTGLISRSRLPALQCRLSDLLASRFPLPVLFSDYYDPRNSPALPGHFRLSYNRRQCSLPHFLWWSSLS